MASSRSLALVLVLFGMAMPRSAWSAAPTPEEKETARTMMDAGHAQRDAGDHKAALALFDGADAIMHVPTTGLEVAREYMALGQLVEARDAIQRVIRSPKGEDEPDVFREARNKAAALDDELAKRIPAVRIIASGAPEDAPMQVMVDGQPVPVAALIAPFRVNPGHHVVVATVASTDVRQEVDVTEGQTVSVTLAFPSSPPAAEADASSSSEPRAEGGGASSAVPWLRWGGVGLAAAGIGVGAVTGAMSLSSTSSAKGLCVNNNCPPASWSDIDSAHTTATVSTVAFCAAGVGAALVVISLFIDPHSGSASPTAASAKIHVRPAPWIGLGGSGIVGTF
jgi:hypothetical protein